MYQMVHSLSKFGEISDHCRGGREGREGGRGRGREGGRREGGGRETAGRDRNGDDCVKVCALLTFPLRSPSFFPPSFTWSETESPVFSHGRSPDTFPPPLLPPPPSPPPHLHPAHTHTVYMNDDVFVKRVRNKFVAKKKKPGSSWDLNPRPSEY